MTGIATAVEALHLFEQIRLDAAPLVGEIRMQPCPEVEIELRFEEQAALCFPVTLYLTGDILNLQAGGFFGEYFPSDQRQVVAEYVEAAMGLLSGRDRVVEFVRSGEVIRAQLQRWESGKWRVWSRYSKLRWPSFERPEERVLRVQK